METVRIGVVGLGNWGKNLVRCFAHMPQCRLTHICDSNAGLLEAQQALYPWTKATVDLNELLGENELDAIVVATPVPSHYALGRQVLEAHKHLFVEKPMTLSTAHALELCALAERYDRKLMVGHLLEYHPAVNWIKHALDAGELGAPLYLYSQRLNLGTVRPDENAFWSLAPHDISVVMYLFNAEPDIVCAHGEGYLQPGIADVVFAYLHFPDGRSAQIHVSWLDPLKERRMVLVGAQKMVVFDDMQPMEQIRVYDKGAVIPENGNGGARVSLRHGDIHIPYLSMREPLAMECQHFIESILHDRTPRSDGWDGVRVVRVLEAADASLAANGQPVKVRNDERTELLCA